MRAGATANLKSRENVSLVAPSLLFLPLLKRKLLNVPRWLLFGMFLALASPPPPPSVS